MLIGIVGAPNKGKSTLFSALTLSEATAADYPFTTINPNFGVAYATRKCVDSEFGVKCNARNSTCENGTRLIPVNIVDVAGLVEGAHSGKGMGNQFLNDLAAADALIVVVDASGATDALGNRCQSCSPCDDVRMVLGEIAEWLASIIKKHMGAISKSVNGVDGLHAALTGLGVTRPQIIAAIEAAALTSGNIAWNDRDVLSFANALIKVNKPMIIAANKSDTKDADSNSAELASEFGDSSTVQCSAAIELALRKAAKQGIIDYAPGAREFKILKTDIAAEQASALEYMRAFLKRKGTNVQELLNAAVFSATGDIVVYPVEDEGKLTDGAGNVLPDAVLIKQGSTALDLAARVHTDLAKGMLHAIDARTKKRLGKDYVLQDNDVIRIVSAR